MIPITEVDQLEVGMILVDKDGKEGKIEAINPYSQTITVNGHIVLWDWDRVDPLLMVKEE